MLKKLIGIGVTGIVVLVTIVLLFSNNSIEDPEPFVKGDVIMPPKVSRPGCEINDNCYIPSQIVIKEGKQVTWINKDSAFHSVTSGFYDVPSDLFDSGYLDPSESYTLTFDEVGTYDYFCTLHPWMNGQVIVE